MLPVAVTSALGSEAGDDIDVPEAGRRMLTYAPDANLIGRLENHLIPKRLKCELPAVAAQQLSGELLQGILERDGYDHRSCAVGTRQLLFVAPRLIHLPAVDL